MRGGVQVDRFVSIRLPFGVQGDVVLPLGRVQAAFPLVVSAALDEVSGKRKPTLWPACSDSERAMRVCLPRAAIRLARAPVDDG